MLTISTGVSTSYLTDEVAKGRENYYVAASEMAGEPVGQWFGTGAADLGLTGDVDPAVLEAVYSRLLDPRDPTIGSREQWDEAASLPIGRRHFKTPEEMYAHLLHQEPAEATPERRAELWVEAGQKSRQGVAFLDVTFSAPKSVSVVGVAFERAAVEAESQGKVEEAAVWRLHHQAVEHAVVEGARASIHYLEEVAGFSRGGRSDAIQWIDAHRWVVAQFLQHDSRDRDPQLHVHQAVLNAVECEDGKWRAIDTAAVFAHKAAAGAVGDRAMEEYLARTLGLRLEARPDGKSREIVGVPVEVLEMFSGRTRAIGKRAADLVERFTATMGREPSPLERGRLAKQATMLTRKGKSHDGETGDERLSRWAQQTSSEVGTTLAGIAEQVLAARQDAGPTGEWSPSDVIEWALAEVAEGSATWTRSHLMHTINEQLPANLGMSQEETRTLLESLTDAALADDESVRLTPEPDLSLRPAEFLLRDGRDVFQRPGAERYATRQQIADEWKLRQHAKAVGAQRVETMAVEDLLRRFADAGVTLGPDQARAVRGVATSGARVETLTAAAGTGKTVVVGAIAGLWASTGRPVIGLAPSQVAADVMADEGVPSVNIERWLRTREEVEDGTLVVVDEAGMASTQQLVQVRERVEKAGGKLLLVGDPRQLGAVGPGGALADVVEHVESYELVEVRRFREGWERGTSLGLRDGDAAALDVYERHGRVRTGGIQEDAERAALRAWLGDTVSGKESILLVGSNEAAGRLSGEARAALVERGSVEESGHYLGRDGNTAGKGDLIQARRNGWHINGTPINRATYRVVDVVEGGSLVVEPTGGTSTRQVTLPAKYVAEHVSLAYASTVHAAQGRTVDTGHSVISGSTSTANAYVSLTRGKECNTAWVVTQTTGEDTILGDNEERKPRTARAVMADVVERDGKDWSAHRERDALEEEHASELTVAGQLIYGINRASTHATPALLDRMEADGLIDGDLRTRLAADEAMGAVERILRDAELAGLDRDVVLREAVESRGWAKVDRPGQVLYSRLHHQLQIESEVRSFADLIPDSVEASHRPWLAERAQAADSRRVELGERCAVEQPRWVVDTLGAPPAGEVERVEWVERAGWAAAYREIAGHESETDPLGPAPPSGLAEKHAIWRTAHQALGMVDRGPDEGAMSEGQLRVRVAAFERERVWAPAAVRDGLVATSEAAQDAHTGAALTDGDVVEFLAEADALTERAAILDEADRVRAEWTAAVTATREAAVRARAELTARGIDVDSPQDRVTAEEWRAAHTAAMEEDEAHRDITPADVLHPVEDVPVTGDVLMETAGPDIRETAVMDPSETADSERGRVWEVDEVSAAVARAQAALLELRAREDLDARAGEDPYDYGTDDSAVLDGGDVMAMEAEA